MKPQFENASTLFNLSSMPRSITRHALNVNNKIFLLVEYFHKVINVTQLLSDYTKSSSELNKSEVLNQRYFQF